MKFDRTGHRKYFNYISNQMVNIIKSRNFCDNIYNYANLYFLPSLHPSVK